MKILKVKIKKKRTLEECRFEYPKRWDNKKIQVLAYEDHPENLGDVVEECLCITDDETGAWLLEQPEATEISEVEANAVGRKWRSAIARITDEEKVIGILKKLLLNSETRIALKKCLTKKEIDSLDEAKNEAGIERKEEFNIKQFI